MNVLIVDDHPVARRGLRIILSEAFADAVCAEASDADSAVALAGEVQPDLLLLDIHMPGEVRAPELCARMREMLPQARIVIVTAFDSAGEIRDCLVAGADGCLLKDTSETDMAAALRTAVAGGSALDSRVAFRLARDMASETAERNGDGLSRRQQEVLRLLAEGRSNRSIAQILGLSEATVKGHVSRLMDKLNASSRLEAVVRAADAGLLLGARRGAAAAEPATAKLSEPWTRACLSPGERVSSGPRWSGAWSRADTGCASSTTTPLAIRPT